MRINNRGNINFNPYSQINKQTPKREKIKREPTKEQLEHIQREQAKEAEYLKGNSLLVPIDWDYIKETINLSPEEKQLRYQQDLQENEDIYQAKMAALDAAYQKELEAIEENGKIEQKKIDEANEARARMIINNIRMGASVSPIDLMFAREVLPEELEKALKEAESNGRNKSMNLGEFINTIDYRI